MGWVNLSDLVTESLQANPLPVSAGGTGVNNMADVIVDQGTSNGWTYIKYASGIAMCWKNVSKTITWAAWGTGYVSNEHVVESYPFSFSEAPTFTVTVVPTTNDWSVISVCSRHTSYKNAMTHTPKVNIMRPSTATDNVSFDFMMNAVGRWK